MLEIKRNIRLIFFLFVVALIFASCATTDIKNRLAEMGVKNASVKKTHDGVTINLENIMFAEESAVLQEAEKEKLKKIAEILKMFDENELLVTGHTALYGTASARKTLSEERARAVANYLVSLGVIGKDKIKIEGFGAEKPVASNKTKAGMAKNRRVEITILDIADDEPLPLHDDTEDEETEED